jgi:hypothetical protein
MGGVVGAKNDELLMVMVGLGRMKKKEHDNWGGVS